MIGQGTQRTQLQPQRSFESVRGRNSGQEPRETFAYPQRPEGHVQSHLQQQIRPAVLHWHQASPEHFHLLEELADPHRDESQFVREHSGGGNLSVQAQAPLSHDRFR